LKLSITRVFFSAFAKIIIFLNITSNLVLILEKTYNFAIATFDSSLFFLYICIMILEFDFTIFTIFYFEDFVFANFIDFDLAILNMSIINNKSCSFFYNASISNKLNLNYSLIKYFSKNFAILFDR
jgi:hypothetical protein